MVNVLDSRLNGPVHVLLEDKLKIQNDMVIKAIIKNWIIG